MAGVVAERAGLGFEETELRLGLPGGGDTVKNCGKRGFEETIDLKLKLNSSVETAQVLPVKDRAKPAADAVVAADPGKPSAPKAQVVGWPPVRSFRKNVMSVQSAKTGSKESGSGTGSGGEKTSFPPLAGAAFVKVSMDGAPYLRKVDLKMYKSYQELSAALEKMFSSFTIGNCESQGINFMNESKLMDLLNGSEYVPTYEDKDGDWMLVGDVPWKMFVESCKRMRIMKGSEAIGLAPRAMEKCKNRS